MRKLGLTVMFPLSPHPFIYSRHHDGTFHTMWSMFPEVVSISILSLQVTQLVNNTVGFETTGLP